MATINRPTTKTVISTTQWGIPITDQVNADTTDIATLKTNTTPTPWTNLVLVNGWTNVGGYQPCQYRKIGDNVQVRGYVGGGAAGSTITTLPFGSRPPVTLILTSNTFTTTRVICMVQITSLGTIFPEVAGNIDLTFLFSSIP